MNNDGPVLVNETLTWDIEVINFAYDPCFVWKIYQVTPDQRSETLMKTVRGENNSEYLFCEELLPLELY